MQRDHPPDLEQRVRDHFEEQVQAIKCRLAELDDLMSLIDEIESSEDVTGVEVYAEEYLPEDAFENVIPIRLEIHMDSLGSNFERILNHRTTVTNDVTVTDDGLYYIETEHSIGNSCA